MSKPHCYGKMDWILKYLEDEIPDSSICSCEYVNSCLRLTNNKRETVKGDDITNNVKGSVKRNDITGKA